MESAQKFTFEFSFDGEKDWNHVYFGPHKIPMRGKIHRVQDVVAIMRDEAGFKVKGFVDTKESYQAFTREYGITPSNFKRVYNAIYQQHHLDPIMKYVHQYAWSNGTERRQVMGVVLHTLWMKVDAIKQMEADGTDHLIPFLVYMGKTPAEMKAILGKGLWKKICQNSRTRNRHIARLMRSSYGSDAKRIRVLNQLPSCVLKRGQSIMANHSIIAVLCKHYPATQVARVSYSRAETELAGYYHTISDTIRMAERLGEEVNPSWSLRRWQEVHDDLSYRITNRKYSKEPIKWIADLPDDIKEVKHEGLTARVLAAPVEIGHEGQTMRHCVAGYIDPVCRGEYVVYHIDDENNPDSSGTTLGVNCMDYQNPEVKTWRYSQHYGACNKKHMMDDRHKEIQDIIIKKLNEGEE